MKKVLATLLLSAACSHAASKVLIQSVPWLHLGAPNGAKTATAAGRLFVAAAADDGSSALVVRSTNDATNWTLQNIPNINGLPLYPAIASDGTSVAVAYQESGAIKMQSCASPQNACPTWTMPVTLGTGTTPSIALVKGTVYAVWADNYVIKMSVFPVAGSPGPPVTVSSGSSSAIRNSMPAVVGWWNAAAGKPVVTVHWVYNIFPAPSQFGLNLMLWTLKKYSLDVNGTWSLTDRKLSSVVATNGTPRTVYAVASTINSSTGAVTTALSLDDFSGPKTYLFNDAGESTILAAGAWITLDAVQGCGQTTVKAALAPMTGTQAYRHAFNRTTLAAVGSPVNLPAGSFTPVVSAWSRYVGSSISPTLSYTDYVDSVQGVPYLGLYNLTAESQRVTGWQAFMACQPMLSL